VALDVITVLGEAAEIIDPRGESEDVSVLCGLVAWALEHPRDYNGWDPQTLATALRWTFDADAQTAEEMAARLAEG
jgi:hypothetical protein